MVEKEYIQNCLEQIEDQLNWGPSAYWHNEMFNELSELIEKRTHVLLSPTTLKRVWGKVNYESSPSISTLNALAVFAGYNNWRDYKTSENIVSGQSRTVKNRYKSRYMFSALAAVAILLISIFAMTDTRKRGWGATKPEHVDFTSKPVTDGLPNSVVFNLDLAGIRSDSIFIQQYWDPTKTIQLIEGQTQATGIYYYPGYFRAKLLIDGTIVKEHDLFIKSKGWISTIDYQPIPKYIKPNFESGLLKLPESNVDEIISSEKPIYSTYHFVNDLGEISGDNFTLSTSLRTVYSEKWAVCQKVQIIILGSKGALIIPLSISGCVSNLNVMLNDLYLSGKEHDLSALAVNLSTFQKVRIRVANRNVHVMLEGKEVFGRGFKNPLGRIVGIRYKFLGVGEVKGIELRNAIGSTVVLK